MHETKQQHLQGTPLVLYLLLDRLNIDLSGLGAVVSGFFCPYATPTSTAARLGKNNKRRPTLYVVYHPVCSSQNQEGRGATPSSCFRAVLSRVSKPSGMTDETHVLPICAGTLHAKLKGKITRLRPTHGTKMGSMYRTCHPSSLRPLDTAAAAALMARQPPPPKYLKTDITTYPPKKN